MATTHYHRWSGGIDTLWGVCSQLLAASGFTDLPTFVDAVRSANPAILDWHADAIADGTLVLLPFQA